MSLVFFGADEPDTITPPKVTLPQPYYVVGFDIGQSIDPSALAALSVTTRQCVWDRWNWASDAERASGTLIEPPASWQGVIDESGARGLLRGRLPVFVDVVHLERLPLRMAYPDQITHVSTLMRRPQLRGATLVVDMTGCGRPVLDLLRRGGLNPVGITITAGKEATHDPVNYRDWHVAKLQLVSRMQVGLNTGELRIAKTLAETPALIQELDNFRGIFSESSISVRYGAREGHHDDLILAIAVANWYVYSRPEPARWGTYAI